MQAFRAIVGRQLRFIHQLDVVPYLPGLDTYAHVPFGTWIPSNFTVVLEDRPPENIDDLNWCAAGLCRLDFNVAAVTTWLEGCGGKFCSSVG